MATQRLSPRLALHAAFNDVPERFPFADGAKWLKRTSAAYGWFPAGLRSFLCENTELEEAHEERRPAAELQNETPLKSLNSMKVLLNAHSLQQ